MAKKVKTYQELLKERLKKATLTTRWLYLQLGYTDTKRVSFWRRVRDNSFTDKERKEIDRLLSQLNVNH